ncbi:protein of unknown function [Candidatus Hydrogenisulfobacillus filiaventi]|uniref:Uncharacterized protein n=1 Tax=Candidatus Hydrogenisulfobacillus filiaventi TaxID=2707344 RepID=A0A6F8ZDL4_9FIRM|nr:protein of unknown function [Candidatus Hydrogenisulfobacillus filiaventi]
MPGARAALPQSRSDPKATPVVTPVAPGTVAGAAGRAGIWEADRVATPGAEAAGALAPVTPDGAGAGELPVAGAGLLEVRGLEGPVLAGGGLELAPAPLAGGVLLTGAGLERELEEAGGLVLLLPDGEEVPAGAGALPDPHVAVGQPAGRPVRSCRAACAATVRLEAI